jgi:uncharacterized NAD(P)/FAD-binding protein YdhS
MNMANAPFGQGFPDGRTFPATPSRPIFVIGGGYTGTAAAIELARTLPADRPIVLCERSAKAGVGVAYATRSAGHFLNVRAANMSAFASEPAHFANWLASRSDLANETVHTEAGAFASRRVYGSYLQSILREALFRAEQKNLVRLLQTDIVDCRQAADGYELVSHTAERFLAGAVVLATGHIRPAGKKDPRLVVDPWADGATDGLDPEKPVLLLGTGLTMVDIVMSLRERGFRGPIRALSRRGLLAQPHRGAGNWRTPDFTLEEKRSVSLMLRRLRREFMAARYYNLDWRAVVDSIRPLVSEIWLGWSKAEQQRFLRHARPWWDTHRHRMAPPNEALIQAELAAGTLQVIAGHPDAPRFDEDAVHVSYRPRGANDRRTLDVQRVIVATGFGCAAETTDPLMRSLFQQGSVRLDALGVGLDVNSKLRVIGSDGHAQQNMWALGPIVRGVFWECTAVPDIRLQVQRLSQEIATHVKS